MISARTTTTTIIPDHTPALNIPSTNEQLARVVVNKAIIANGKYFLMFMIV